MRGIRPPAEGDKLLGVDRGASKAGLDKTSCEKVASKAHRRVGLEHKSSQTCSRTVASAKVPLNRLERTAGSHNIASSQNPRMGRQPQGSQHEHTGMDIRTRTKRRGRVD